MSLTPTRALKGVIDEYIRAESTESLSKAMQYIQLMGQSLKIAKVTDTVSSNVANITPPENGQKCNKSQVN